MGAITYSGALCQAALSSFMLFVANFLTIEIAAFVVFALEGYRRPTSWSMLARHLLLVSALILGVAIFLSFQLESLLRERRLLGQTRAIISAALTQIPGATIDQLNGTFSRGRFDIQLQALSPQEMSPKMVAEIEKVLTRSLQTQTRLTVRTLVSVYASA